MIHKLVRILFCTALFINVLSCSTTQTTQSVSSTSTTAGAKEKDGDKSENLSIPFEKFKLDNGLTVIMHVDKSDPVVAVSLTAHVGSAREKTGRTGFAHLFEHLLFLESENLGKGGLDAMSARIGGAGANGSTSRDVTNYYQAVPSDALEKMIWAEADKLGYFINTVTDPVLAKEKQVVKNEKRQSVDNQPYGAVSYVIDKNLYPEGHPYNWQVIGSLEDLQNATLQDVKDFYKRWYTPNNTVLTIAGDFDSKQARTWVNKYFGELSKGQEVSTNKPLPVAIPVTKKLFYVDNFANQPMLTMTWPGVENFNKDVYALNVLSSYLSRGKNAPFNRVVVESKQQSSDVRLYHQDSELAGQVELSIQAVDGTKLDDVAQSIQESFALFEKEGISEKDLNRIKTQQETAFYYRLSSVQGKGFLLTDYEILTGNPGYLAKDIKGIQEVTANDVKRVYNTYIKNKNYIAVSVVPKGQEDLKLNGSVIADVEEEKIIQGAEESFDASIEATYERTASSFDRTIEPDYGIEPELAIPTVWKTTYPSGMKALGIVSNEVPLIQMQLHINGGMLLEDASKRGVANIMAALLTKGTEKRSREQLENDLATLGASINASAGDTGMNINVNTLSRNVKEVVAILEEVILKPRWDAQEFELIKNEVKDVLMQQLASPNAIARNEFSKALYGKDHILAQNNLGTPLTIDSITLDDVKNYYNQFITPQLASLRVVGDIKQQEVDATFASLNSKWQSKKVLVPAIANIPKVEKSKIYFYDVPNAKQSVITIGNTSIKGTDPDSYAVGVMNYRLGGGGFASQLTQQLREGKGYTYGIRSNFSGDENTGAFTVSTGVRSNVTYESAQLIKEIVSDYGKNFSNEDLEITKSYMIKSSARAFETLGAKLNMLDVIDSQNYSPDYALKNQQKVKQMTLGDIKGLASKYLNTDKMVFLIVGDAATQLAGLEKLGFGKPVLLNNN